MLGLTFTCRAGYTAVRCPRNYIVVYNEGLTQQKKNMSASKCFSTGEPDFGAV